MPQSAHTPTASRPQAPRPSGYRVFAAAGNRFALLDATAHVFSDPADLARRLCGPQAPQAPRLGQAPEQAGAALDGALFVLPPTDGGACRMLLHNADGSRAEACGNGLRCVALFARRAGLVQGPRVLVETDCGMRTVELLGEGLHGAPGSVPAPVASSPAAPSFALARASMGAARVLEREVELAHKTGSVRATLVDVGNPHCVVAVPDVDAVAVELIGADLEVHSRFPAGTNVEFVARAGPALRIRIWERGVGETGACGTGACAAALALTDSDGQAPFAVDVISPGGKLIVERDEQRELWLTGPCEALEWVEYPEALE